MQNQQDRFVPVRIPEADMKGNKGIKPSGWWTTHPTLLTASVHGLVDGNGDGLGDFEGLRGKLDFFMEMGISGFRFQHVGLYGDDYKWSGLVQQDWYDVDPHYGTMEDFDRLMRDCREKDVRIIMMAVPEYLGWHHPDYLAAKESRAKGIDDPRIKWFEWNDDGTVLTCWDRPGPDLSNPDYVDAFLKHVGFWMDKGIAGWDADAVGVWHNLTLEALRRINEFIIRRGGFVTAENMVLLRDVTKYGGFNAGTGYLRTEFYNELKAIVEHKAQYIRDALKVREELIGLGMFPYQQFGDQTHSILTNSWACHILEMVRLQVAFNAVLPDQVWIQANFLTFTRWDEKPKTGPHNTGWGAIDWDALHVQESNPDSPFSHLKRVFALRAKHEELSIGEIEEVPTNHPEDVFAAIRTAECSEKRALVIFNFSDQPREVVIHFPDAGMKSFSNYLNGEKMEIITNSLKIRLNLFGYKFLKIL